MKSAKPYKSSLRCVSPSPLFSSPLKLSLAGASANFPAAAVSAVLALGPGLVTGATAGAAAGALVTAGGSSDVAGAACVGNGSSAKASPARDKSHALSATQQATRINPCLCRCQDRRRFSAPAAHQKRWPDRSTPCRDSRCHPARSLRHNRRGCCRCRTRSLRFQRNPGQTCKGCRPHSGVARSTWAPTRYRTHSRPRTRLSHNPRWCNSRSRLRARDSCRTWRHYNPGRTDRRGPRRPERPHIQHRGSAFGSPLRRRNLGCPIRSCQECYGPCTRTSPRSRRKPGPCRSDRSSRTDSSTNQAGSRTRISIPRAEIPRTLTIARYGRRWTHSS